MKLRPQLASARLKASRCHSAARGAALSCRLPAPCPGAALPYLSLCRRAARAQRMRSAPPRRAAPGRAHPSGLACQACCRPLPPLPAPPPGHPLPPPLHRPPARAEAAQVPWGCYVPIPTSRSTRQRAGTRRSAPCQPHVVGCRAARLATPQCRATARCAGPHPPCLLWPRCGRPPAACTAAACVGPGRRPAAPAAPAAHAAAAPRLWPALDAAGVAGSRAALISARLWTASSGAGPIPTCALLDASICPCILAMLFCRSPGPLLKRMLWQMAALEFEAGESPSACAVQAAPMLLPPIAADLWSWGGRAPEMTVHASAQALPALG